MWSSSQEYKVSFTFNINIIHHTYGPWAKKEEEKKHMIFLIDAKKEGRREGGGGRETHDRIQQPLMI